MVGRRANVRAGPFWVPSLEPWDEIFEGDVGLIHKLVVFILTDVVKDGRHFCPIIMERLSVRWGFMPLIAVMVICDPSCSFVYIHETYDNVGANR